MSFAKPRGVKVPPTSAKALEDTAKNVRAFLHKADTLKVDVVRVIEHILHNMGVNFDVVESADIDGEEARTIPDDGAILISQKTYDALHDGELRPRFTLSHEIAHLLVHRGIKPSFARAGTHSFFEDSEWQADAFAAAFLAPADLVQEHCQSVNDIMQNFGMSQGAANIRAQQLRKKGVISW